MKAFDIRNIPLSLDAALKEGDEPLRRAVSSKLGIPVSSIAAVKLLKRSVDARKKNDVHFVMTVCAEVSDEAAGHVRGNPDVSPGLPVHLWGRMPGMGLGPQVPPEGALASKQGDASLSGRPVVCGFGPAGMFAALELAAEGAYPVVLERGSDVATRRIAVETFFATGALDTHCNVQFGEGGAGTFSDGKLSTGTHNPYISRVLRTFVSFGAPEEILWQAKPHIGTDLLAGIVVAFRKRIEALGGTVLFDTQLVGLNIEDDRLQGITVQDEKGLIDISCEKLVLAIGHSARDTFQMLYDSGMDMQQKAFSMGVRVEHLQHDIDAAQYGRFAGHAALEAADYRLACHLPDGRGVYSFCMCPGGQVIAAATEEGGVVTNGMSTFARDGINANAAFLVGVTPDDFPSAHPLAGVELQRTWEQAAFMAGGGAFRAPAQLMGDFLAARATTEAAGESNVVHPTYPRGVTWTALDECLPRFIIEALRQAAPVFDKKLHGFASPSAVLTGIETRSSSPVRLVRAKETYVSSIAGIFPCGEGAGYAGGIMSAAVDGLRVAEVLLAT